MLFPALIVGAIIGSVVAIRVNDRNATASSCFALLVGLAAAYWYKFRPTSTIRLSAVESVIHEVEIFLGVFIGAITFTGSIIAYGKLAGSITGRALVIPGRHIINICMVVGCLILVGMYLNDECTWTLIAMTLISFISVLI